VRASRILDYLDGLILHQMALPEPGFDPTPGIEELLSTLVHRRRSG
jgi:hypothetical protein